MMKTEKQLLLEIEEAKTRGDRSAQGWLLLHLAKTIPTFAVNLERIGWTLMSARELLAHEGEVKCLEAMAEVFFFGGNFTALREVINGLEGARGDTRTPGEYDIVRARFFLRDDGRDVFWEEFEPLAGIAGTHPFNAHLCIAKAEAHIAGLEFDEAVESAEQAVKILESSENISQALLFHALFYHALSLIFNGDFQAAEREVSAASRIATQNESSFEIFISEILRGIVLISLSEIGEAKSALERGFLCSQLISPGENVSYLFPDIFFPLTGMETLSELYERIIAALEVCVDSGYCATTIILTLFACLINAYYDDFTLWHDTNRAIDELISESCVEGYTTALKRNMLALKSLLGDSAFKKIEEDYENEPL